MRDLDWRFIWSLEGRAKIGYVPDPEKSQSGVTFGCGVDLGNVNPATLPLSLQDKLTKYCHATKGAAVALIQAYPLVLSDEEIDILDLWAANRLYEPLTHSWNIDCPVVFDEISFRLATVVMSVTYQYGTPWKRCPKFWEASIGLNTANVLAELENFGDSYPTRHAKEAAYLRGDSNVRN